MAICRRNHEKLAALASEAHPQWDSSNVFVVADLEENYGDIVAEFVSAKVVLACADPYRQCGLEVLRAAMEARCDYLDLCDSESCRCNE